MGFSVQESGCFKSCPRVGGIAHIVDAVCAGTVSSRAPVWGASVNPVPGIVGQAVFQVVPPCGGHQQLDAVEQQINRFQDVPPCGGHL